MKKIMVSQRVNTVVDYVERRDSLDQQWAAFLDACGAIAIPVPNHPKTLPSFLETIVPDGIVLSGGNSPMRYGGSAPERDDIDCMLIDYAIKQQCPLTGVCRGMQSVLMYFGGTLRSVEGHVATTHKLEGAICREVNSYHQWAATEAPKSLRVLAKTADGTIEATKHEILPIFAIMWHPERNSPFVDEDIYLFQNTWSGGGAF